MPSAAVCSFVDFAADVSVLQMLMTMVRLVLVVASLPPPCTRCCERTCSLLSSCSSSASCCRRHCYLQRCYWSSCFPSRFDFCDVAAPAWFSCVFSFLPNEQLILALTAVGRPDA